MLTDSPSSIFKKIRSAVTDSIPTITYDPIGRPGVSNLLNILAAFTPGFIDMEKLTVRYEGKSAGDLKKDVAEAIIEGWRKPREEFERLREDRAYLAQVLLDGSKRAKTLSQATLERVRRHVGLGNPDGVE